MDHASDDRYVRYAIARLVGLSQRLVVAGQRVRLHDPAAAQGPARQQDGRGFRPLLFHPAEGGPYGRQRGIHQAAKMYDHSQEWVTHASIQNGDLTKVIGWRDKLPKADRRRRVPLRGKHPRQLGQAHRPGNGAPVLGRHASAADTSATAKRSRTRTTSSGGPRVACCTAKARPRIAFLRKTMEALPYTDMIPAQPDPDVLVLSKPGSCIWSMRSKQGPIQLHLDGDHDYTVEAIDTWNMTTEQLKQREARRLRLCGPSGGLPGADQRGQNSRRF